MVTSNRKSPHRLRDGLRNMLHFLRIMHLCLLMHITVSAIVIFTRASLLLLQRITPKLKQPIALLPTTLSTRRLLLKAFREITMARYLLLIPFLVTIHNLNILMMPYMSREELLYRWNRIIKLSRDIISFFRNFHKVQWLRKQLVR